MGLIPRAGSTPVLGTVSFIRRDKDLQLRAVSPFFLHQRQRGAKWGQRWFCVGFTSLVASELHTKNLAHQNEAPPWIGLIRIVLEFSASSTALDHGE